MDVETETSIDNPMRTVEINDNSVKSSDNKEPYTVGKPWAKLPLADKIEKVWCKVFSYIPFHRYFWTSYPHPQVVIEKRKHHTLKLLEQREKENKEDYDASIRIRSMWNIRNLIDSIFFNWTTYLDSDKYLDDLDTKGQYYTELSNVGLLSALISTICFSMLTAAQSSADITTPMGAAYALLWFMSSVLTLMSTVLAILIIMGMNETANDEEVDQMVVTFQYLTFGIGGHMPLLLLYLGIMCAAAATFLNLFLFFPLTTAIIGMFVTFPPGGLLFVYAYIQMVASLHSTRRQSKFLQHGTHRVSVSVATLRLILEQFLKTDDSLKNDPDNLPPTHEFISYVVFADIGKGRGDSLNHFSEKRARKFYEAYCDRRLFKSKVEVNALTFSLEEVQEGVQEDEEK